jgi:O-antigen ligase
MPKFSKVLSVLFYTSVAAFAFGQFASIYNIGEGNIYIFDLVVSLFAFTGVVYFLFVKRTFKIPGNLMLFIFFGALALLSLFIAAHNFSNEQVLVAFSYWLRWFSYLTAVFVLYNMLKSGFISRENIFKAFIISGVFIALVGFIQLIVLPDFTTLDPSLGWDPHKNRLASTFFDPNFAGAYLTLCLILLFEAIRGKKQRAFNILSFIIILTALFLTFSRSAWLMLAIVVFVYGIFKYRLLLVAALVIAFLAYFAVPRVQTRISGITDPADSAQLRLTSWQHTAKIAADNWAFGTGFNTYRYVQQSYGFLDADTVNIHSGAGSDSSLLFVLATTGIFGFIFYTLGFLFPVTGIIKGKANLMLMSVIVSLLVESQFVNALFYPQIMFLWLSLFATCSFSDR